MHPETAALINALVIAIPTIIGIWFGYINIKKVLDKKVKDIEEVAAAKALKEASDKANWIKTDKLVIDVARHDEVIMEIKNTLVALRETLEETNNIRMLLAPLEITKTEALLYMLDKDDSEEAAKYHDSIKQHKLALLNTNTKIKSSETSDKT